MKKMTDQQADALRDKGKVIFRSSDTEVIWLAAFWAVLVTGGLIFLFYVEELLTWKDYAYLAVYILAGYGFPAFMLFANKRSYTVLDHKGITQQSIFDQKQLFWGEVKFIGTCSDRRGSSIIASPIPLPEGEGCVGENRRISDSALWKLRSSRMISIPNTSFTENRLAIVMEMWEKYKDTAEATVGEFRYFPRQPR